ncbi:MAG: response regulator [Desulfobacteraceae bacterium]|nr:MAG: response regulator [Desulfobacteraceae bacterium]
MEAGNLLEGKRVLIVDDEPDVLDILTEFLSACMVDRASTFETAKELLETERYDAVVLDIMGVQGFDLLKIASQQDIPALMLTAHSLNVESLKKSAEEGASYFVPKEKMTEIATFLADVLEARRKKENPWMRWYKRLCGFFDANMRFNGPNWRDQHKEFWDEKLKNLGCSPETAPPGIVEGGGSAKKPE